MDSTTRGLFLALAILLVAALSFSMVMGGMMGPGMMPGRGWSWGFGMGVGGLAMLAFWGALIVGLVLLVRGLGGTAEGRWHLSPTDILKRRYAKGEISREAYEQMRKDLESSE